MLAHCSERRGVFMAFAESSKASMPFTMLGRLVPYLSRVAAVWRDGESGLLCPATFSCR